MPTILITGAGRGLGLELVEEPVRGLTAMQDLRERVAVRFAEIGTARLAS